MPPLTPPAVPATPSAPPAGAGPSCRGCGYALRGLPAGRCPECGRAFDPADPRTVAAGRPPGPLARRLQSPTGRPTRLALVLATAAVAFATRPQLGPVGQWDLAPVDLRLDTHLLDRDAVRTPTDVAYAAGLWLWAVGLGWLVGRRVLRVVARRRYDVDGPAPPAERRLSVAAAFVAFCGLAALSVACVLVGWPYRMGQHAAAEYMSRRTPIGPVVPAAAAPRNVPAALPAARWNRAVRAAVHQAPTADQRIAGLAMLAEDLRSDVSAVVREAVERETDPAVLQWHVRLLGVIRDPGLVPVARRLLAADDGSLRVAALDAVAAAADETSGGRLWSSRLASQPNVPLNGILFQIEGGSRRGAADEGAPRAAAMALPGDLRAAVVERMVSGADDAEREAATRAAASLRGDRLAHTADSYLYLANRRSTATRPADAPPGGRLRLTECGVWIDADGPAGSVAERAAVDRVPPFVHAYGPPQRSIIRGALGPATTGLHAAVMLTADAATAVAVGVEVRRGRAELAYPKPDDYWSTEQTQYGSQKELTALSTRPSPAAVGRPARPPLTDRRFEPPWVLSNPRWVGPPLVATAAGGMRADVTVALGFRWDWLLVSPDRRPWMSPPDAPPDLACAWWSRLRDVPCSWVSSRGESERFLYYDGPTLLPPPVRVTAAGPGRLSLSATDDPETSRAEGAVERGRPSESGMVLQTARAGRRRERRGMRVDVRPDGAVSAEAVDIPPAGKITGTWYHVAGSGPPLAGPAAEAELRAWVVDAGLTGPEADGMMACWREPFFATPGRRFLLLLSAADYDVRCPMQVRPTPTESARVGLVWTELPAGPP